MNDTHRRSADHDQTDDYQKRSSSESESNLTVHWWGIIVLIAVIFAFFFNTLLSHGERISKIETSTEYIVKSLDNLMKTAQDSNQMIHKHMGENQGRKE
jgi:hypothetical protein